MTRAIKSNLLDTMHYSQQQNALGYNLSMQGIGTVAIDGPRFEEFVRSRKVVVVFLLFFLFF